MKIVLIGNYPADRQESMEKFALMLYDGFSKKNIAVEICRPPVLLGRGFAQTTSGLGKWMGYFDKWVLFPFLLIFKKKRNSFFHVCDHSNAFYLKFLPEARAGITCHDVLAIKGALGDRTAYCDASVTGKLLQKWILKNLKQAKKIAAVSAYTMRELRLITGNVNTDKDWKIIYNGFNQPFNHISKETASKLLFPYKLHDKPFLLHVGSALPRKNRKLLVEMLYQANDAGLYIVYAGKAIDSPLQQMINKYNLQNRCISIAKPSSEVLNALYNACKAFIFPSYAEGFGWPVIEAQACGAPVIASNLEPMKEIGGNGALYADPNDAQTFIACFKALKDTGFKTSLIQKGFENSMRFSVDRMLNEYLDFITGN